MGGIKVAALALLVAVGVFVPAGAATAQRVVIADEGTDDVWATVFDPASAEGWDGTFTQDGSVPNVDVVSTTVRSTRTELRVTAAYVKLKSDAPAVPELATWLRLRDGGGVLVRTWFDDDGEEQISFFTDRTAKPGGKLHPGACPTAEVTFDFRADTGTVILPLACLPGDSDWVKYHGNALGWESLSPTTWNLWEDNVTDGSYDKDPFNRSCFWKCTGWTKVRMN